MVRRFLSLLILCLFFRATYAQTDPGTTANADSKVLDSLFDFQVIDTATALQEKTRSVGEILAQVISRAQKHAIELSQIKLELSETVDTLEMSEELPDIRRFVERLKLQTLDDSSRFNLRYVQGMDNLIKLVEDVNQDFDKKIKTRLNKLTEVGNKLKEIRTDSLFNLKLRDTTLIPAINSELAVLKKSIKQTDSIYSAQEILLVKLQAKISENTVSFLELQQFLNAHRKQLEHQSWTKEINYIWEKPNFEKITSLRKVFFESFALNFQLLQLYVSRTKIPLILSCLVLIGLYFGLRFMLNSISNGKEFASLILDRVVYFKKHTLFSTVIILLPFLLLIFTKPPLVFVSLLSLILVIATTPLIKEQFGERFNKIWLLFLLPYLLLAYSGLHWKVAFQERWYVFISCIIFIVMGWLVWKDVKLKKSNGAIFLKSMAILLMLIESFALLANILGRFNLSKTYAVTGAITFYRAVGLYLFVQVFLEAVYLLIEYSKKESDSFTPYFDFQDLQKRVKGFLYLFALGIWLYGLLWHLGYFDHVFDWIVEFLEKNRMLGNTEFQFGSILLFIIILYFSTFLANNIAYFASIKDQKSAVSRKQRLGTSILLIRLAVLIFGFFIGMTAAKIPFDKIAIVLGALSVGIGFGLQTIINNLVSGIILAFERPIQIGDEIQVGPNSGTVKDVGIRASKIQAYDGSEIVIPNGDLLSQSLVNWTLSDKKRRVELIIGVGYESDMKQVKSLLESILTSERILKAPTPKVYMQTFNESSVDFRILFWVESIDVWLEIRSEIMTKIFETFVENKIEIPFPKRDLYLKTVPSSWQENVSRPGELINPSAEKASQPETPSQKKSPEN